MEPNYKLIDINNRKVNITYTGKVLTPSENIKLAISKHWEEISKDKKFFFNGEIFSIDSFEENDNELNIKIDRTNYAHYLADRHKVPEVKDYPCHVAYSCVIIETSDNYFVMGENTNDTAHPDRLQFIGGAIDNDDLMDDGVTIDIKGNAARETEEEIGISTNNAEYSAELEPIFLKLNNNEYNSIGVIYLLKTSLDKAMIKDIFDKHNEKLALNDELIEFKDLIFVKTDIESINEFERTNTKEIKDYMLEALRQLCKKP